MGVGYSYGDTKVRSTDESAKNVYAFLQLFFQQYPQYAENDFHISGESYGGHYLPALSTQIIHGNKDAEEKNLLTIPYKSVLIGNGWTDPRTQFKEYSTYGCANDSSYKPIFDEKTCEKMVNSYGRCKTLMDTCYNMPNSFTCIPANIYCEKSQASAFDKTGLNPYDIRRKCEGDTGLCYDLIEAIDGYANRKDVRQSLGVDEAAGEYTGCSNAINYRFYQTGDK